jgi:hypothetical protein
MELTKGIWPMIDLSACFARRVNVFGAVSVSCRRLRRYCAWGRFRQFGFRALDRAHGHFGEPIGTLGHGQFFQLPPSPIQGAPLLAGAGLSVGAGVLVGAGELVVSLGVLGGGARRWST